MTRIIFNADDFGYSEAVSSGIIKAHVDGLIKSTTLMVNMDSTLHAVNLAKQNPELYVGLHVNIVIGKPCSDPSRLQSLVNEQGVFNTKERLQKGLSLDEKEILLETKAQAQRFKELMEHYPTHIEGHAVRDDGLFKERL